MNTLGIWNELRKTDALIVLTTILTYLTTILLYVIASAATVLQI